MTPIENRRTKDRAPLPTHPFAPGVIQGPRSVPLPITMEDDDGEWLPLSLAQTLKLLGIMLVLGTVAGFLVERFA